MTDDEFRADLLSVAASRAEIMACGLREGFVAEVLERLAEAGEIPDAEPCAEMLTGFRNRKLEIDAWASDEADDSLHLFICIGGISGSLENLTLSEAREAGFQRLLGVFDQARDGWLSANIEESRPLWAMARQIKSSAKPAALRLHVLTDRSVSERLREIAGSVTSEGIPVTFQIWDLSRLRRIHDARNIRDDLVVDFSHLQGGGLPALPASLGSGDYTGYLVVIPGDVLADIYVQHGSRLLEGNVRTFLGRSGKVNKGIAATVAKDPAKFFAYNNGITTTASEVSTRQVANGAVVITSATDLQIVNGAQTTASLAVALRDKTLQPNTVFVPMKLSVVTANVGEELIPLISKYANSQNGVRPSDFFANHAFHRRIEEISRRILPHAKAGSQIQSHWYYERARGQHLNDQNGMTGAKRNQFLLVNPRNQVIRKTDLAKVECSFDLEPDIASKGAEKAFISFAERITKDWEDDIKRQSFDDDWFRSAVARLILFRTAEAVISKASWYEGGYRAQIAAYTCARLAELASKQPGSAGIDYLRIWGAQSAGPVLEKQITTISKTIARGLRSPPQAGRNVGEWMKQAACRKIALETPVNVVEGLADWLQASDEGKRKVSVRTATRGAG